MNESSTYTVQVTLLLNKVSQFIIDSYVYVEHDEHE